MSAAPKPSAASIAMQSIHPTPRPVEGSTCHHESGTSLAISSALTAISAVRERWKRGHASTQSGTAKWNVNRI
jgi:hypothetical protein